MDGQQVKVWESRCIEEHPPACTSACPVHVDARGMMTLLAKGDFKAAYALFSRFIPFPAIIGHICDHPCETACKRSEAGAAIRIHELERACANSGFDAVPLRPNKQLAPKHIAIVGAGISGLSAAAELGIKGHAVVVFEANSRAFERLRGYDAQVLPPAAIDTDLVRIAGAGMELRLNESVDLSTSSGIAGLVVLVVRHEHDEVHRPGHRARRQLRGRVPARRSPPHPRPRGPDPVDHQPGGQNPRGRIAVSGMRFPGPPVDRCFLPSTSPLGASKLPFNG